MATHINRYPMPYVVEGITVNEWHVLKYNDQHGFYEKCATTKDLPNAHRIMDALNAHREG
jgi:hypothetical protein